MEMVRTDTEKRHGGQGGGGGGRGRWEFGVSRGKLLYIGWISSKVLLDSAENCIQ